MEGTRERCEFGIILRLGENVDYYVAKLDELVKKFANVAPEAKQATLL